MKNRKFQVAVLALVLLVLTSFITPQASGGYVTVRTLEVSSFIWDSKITIVYEDGTVEDVPLQRFKYSSLTPNTREINQVQNKLVEKGYTLVSASSGNGDAVLTNMFIF